MSDLLGGTLAKAPADAHPSKVGRSPVDSPEPIFCGLGAEPIVDALAALAAEARARVSSPAA